MIRAGVRVRLRTRDGVGVVALASPETDQYVIRFEGDEHLVMCTHDDVVAHQVGPRS